MIDQLYWGKTRTGPFAVRPASQGFASVSRISLDSTLEMIAHLDGARSRAELCGRVLQLTKSYGIEHILAGILPTRDATEIEQLDGLLLVDWPSEWLERYALNHYAEIDPTIKIMKSSQKPVNWNEISNLLEKQQDEYLVMNEARTFKLYEGLTVPIGTAGTRQAAFSFSGQHLDLRETTAGLLSLIANYAFATSVKLRGASVAPAPALAPRQMDVVRWAAEGKTDWEIGMILSISEYTVDKYVRQVKEKLEATNRVQMIAKAIRRGLIN